MIPRNKQKEYHIWRSARARCYRTTHADYDSYGGRGINMCKEWREDYMAFLTDMGPKPEGCSLDRIDNNGNYEPGNCRWATPKQQSANIRCNHNIEFNGEIHHIAEWARIVDIHVNTLYKRLNLGWSIEDTLTKRPRGK